MYVHQVLADACRGQKAQDTLDLKLCATMWVLELNSGPLLRAANALYC